MKEGGSRETNWPIIDLICGPAEFDRCPDQSDTAVGLSQESSGKAREPKFMSRLVDRWLGKYWLF